MSNAADPVAWVRRRLGYEPAQPALFIQALTHRSAAGDNNERLEFLGDAVLDALAGQGDIAGRRRIASGSWGDR